LTYAKGSAWKRANWDKWTFWKKGRHIIAIIFSLICVGLMFALFAYGILIVFGISGLIDKIRDTILLEFAHWLFG
jgi:hypothetical protein